MKTLHELDEQYQKERSEIERRTELLKTLPQGLPGEVRSIHFFKGRPWVCYEVAILEQAAEIIETYAADGLMDMAGIESGCFSVAPVGEHGKEYQGKTPRWEVPEGIVIKQSGGKGFHSAAIVCYPIVPHVRVEIEVEQFPYPLRAHLKCTYNKYGDPVTCVFSDATLLQAAATARVKYAGGSRDAFQIYYVFSGVDHFREVIKEVE